ncbi:hypothetical protein ASD16_07280 [Cellulomonas sp. Root485]|uniref:hypothetical protein n=1 Tax=Cellulomonas sp. Root485 TaxID=1736546 RepID=UPI0006F98D89|nr:hypothetical protein [Cellulomonas sp. Root485]KQY25227.1 hypothetical protein ASD16_07280 [Cellulomonas sp. Root485]
MTMCDDPTDLVADDYDSETTPGPDGPPPAPWAGPGPVPPDELWWRCWPRPELSGRYHGRQGVVALFGRTVDLRVDIDQRYSSESPVMNRVSGDFYSTRPVKDGQFWRIVRTYENSWIVDSPVVRWGRCAVTITGRLRFWQGVHPVTRVTIRIPWTNGGRRPGVATFRVGRAETAYTITYEADTFRDVRLELDYCSSVDVEPRVPIYGSRWHDNRPTDTPDRVLTIETAYREAGIGVTIDPTHTVIDDSAAGFASWSPGELHDAMETAFSRFSGTWPSWNMWGLQAGSFDNSGVGGIMFDAAAGYGGAGDAPERQGFAVFRDHSWFNDLITGTSTTQDQARAMRQFLYTWVHEAGHAFNLLHSWNKSRPSSLSWMNYDWKYDQLNGADAFWGDFRFRFDDEELIHMRHGDRASVIMGGDPWASGGHLESPADSTIQSEPGGPVELLVRSKSFFDFLEPVELEFRLRNRTSTTLTVDGRLDPKYGTTTVFVQRPDGSRIVFDSLFCLAGIPELLDLAPSVDSGGAAGPDRLSVLVPLTYGAGGFTFAVPGQYLVRAIYHGAGMLQTSNTLRLTVGFPTDKATDRFADDFLTREVGLTLALGGSKSPYLAAGFDALQEASERFADEALGMKASVAVAQSIGDDFYRQDERTLVKHHSADPEAALDVTAATVQAYHESGGRAENLPYGELVGLRSSLFAEVGETDTAANEAETLADDLAARGVRENVVDEVRSAAAELRKS